jgi:hypothetical protein
MPPPLAQLDGLLLLQRGGITSLQMEGTWNWLRLCTFFNHIFAHGRYIFGENWKLKHLKC